MKAECKKIIVKTLKKETLLEETEAKETVTGEVISTGPQYPGDAVKGDIVVYASISGRRTKLDGVEYITLNADEICGILEDHEK